jgi:hypothetical protein
MFDNPPLKRYTVIGRASSESDFWDREMVLDGIETVQEMLADLKGG